MAPFNKRQFLRLAGLAIAERIIPRRLLAQAEPTESDRKLVIVTFGGGVRYSETFAPDGLHNIRDCANCSRKGCSLRTASIPVCCRTTIRRLPS